MSDTVQIVCPHCHAVNRLPKNKLRDGGKCGKCKQPLFTGKPVNLNAQSFLKHSSKSDIPLVVDFWAAWCGPCKMMAPAFEQAASQMEPAVRFGKVDTEKEQVLAGQFAIRSIPTMIMYKNGKEVARQSGAIGAADIMKWIRQYTG